MPMYISRNAAVAMGNSGQPKFRPILETLTKHPDTIVQEHARWVLAPLPDNKEASQDAL